MVCIIPVIKKISVADPGCLSQIPDTNSFHPGSASKNLSMYHSWKFKDSVISILTPKTVFKLSEI
jgi:hypothetical protein